MEKIDYLEESHSKKEKIILIVYSFYTLAMSLVTYVLGWASWILPFILIGMAVAWWISIKKYRTYRFRAFCISAIALFNFVIYGMHSQSLPQILSTMGALVILLGIFNIPQIVHLAVAASLFLMLYHGFVICTIHASTIQDVVRVILQIVSVFTIECVTYYLVKTHIDVNETLVSTIETLTKAEQSKDDFMANVSHEIRTPINTVCGMSEMLLREDLSESAREYTFDIQTAGRNLLSVVSDILDFSELESGKMDLIEEPYNITSTVNDVMNMAVALKNNKNVELIVDCDASIPRNLLGDEQKLRRVIMNLVSNAIKFTREGCVLIRFSARKEEYGINLTVSVKDTGIGIQKENLEKLFTTFNQVDTKKNREEGGIGLGLAISQAIVKKMGGFITVKSTYGKGSEVQFVIPQKVLEDEPIVTVKNPDKIRVLGYINMEKYDYSAIREGYADSIERMARQLRVSFQLCRNLPELKRRIEKKKYTHVFISWEEYCEDKPYFDALAEKTKVVLILDRENDSNVNRKLLKIYKPFYVLSAVSVINGESVVQSIDSSTYANHRFIAPKASVLVVDDNIMNLRVVEGLLRPYRIKVFTATSGKEALQKLDTMEYDFVFMDHMMPEMDGVETLYHIRQKQGNYFKTLPVIALTANAISGAREMFLSEGFADFVAKPIELSVLERVLRRYIPEDKIIKVEEYETTKQEKTKLPSEEKREHNLSMQGINVQQGIVYCGGLLEDYIDVVSAYYKTGLHKIQEIEDSYQKKDWKNYTILVHAVKSTSLGIGAEELSEMAKALEAAGQSSDEAYIKEHHEAMMQEYHKIMDVIKENIITEKTEDPSSDTDAAKIEDTSEEHASEECGTDKEIGKDRLTELFTQLAEQLDTFESTAVEELLKELFQYEYQGQSLKDMLASVEEKAEAFDFMGAEEELVKLQEKMR